MAKAARGRASSPAASSSVARVELGVDQLEAAPELGDDRLLDLVEGRPGDLVGDAADRLGIPVELERLVGGLERLAQHLRAVDDEHAADVRAARDQALADPGQLRPPAGVDAPGPRAVLARHLADPGVDAELPQGLGDDRRRSRSKRSWVPLDRAARPAVAQANASVPSWKAAARPPASRTTGSNPAARAAATARLESRRGAVLLREGELAGRAVEAEGRGELARRDPR